MFLFVLSVIRTLTIISMSCAVVWCTVFGLICSTVAKGFPVTWSFCSDYVNKPTCFNFGNRHCGMQKTTVTFDYCVVLYDLSSAHSFTVSKDKHELECML